MAERRFARWVEPLASQMRDSRAQVIAFARSAPAGIWAKPSPLEGWTYRDVLAHLAGGNDEMLQKILRAVVSGQPVDPAVLDPDTDGENADGVAERRGWPLERLFEALEADGTEMQELLAGLKESDKDIRPGAASWTLEGLLRVVHEENHDLEHLTQLRAGIEAAYV